VTLLEYSKLWPTGIKDIEKIVGGRGNLDNLRRLSILVTVGGNDVKGDVSKTIRVIKEDAFGDQIEDNRLIYRRQGNWWQIGDRGGLNVELVVVPDVAH
jgi:hypothetical protein